MQERLDPTLEAQPSAPDSSGVHEAPPPVPPTRRRWLRVLAGCLCVCLVLLLLLIGSIWWWAGRDNSLQSTIVRIGSWMPADQTLEAKGVRGSLRSGGDIDWLRWSSPNFQVEMQGAHIQWRLQPLLSRELRFGKIDMESLRLSSTPASPADDSPSDPLESLILPMRLDVPVRIAELVWEGPAPTVLHDLHGHYRYDGTHHQLEISSLRYAQGTYEAQVQLQAAAPMALQADLIGAVQAPLPNQPEQTLPILAEVHIKGTLATEAARLQVKADARTLPASGAGPAVPAAPAPQERLTAQAEASIRPWLPQPVEQAQVNLQHVDIALFVPDFPHTDLSGQLQAGPEGSGWKLHTRMTNALHGPWDQQALPVRQLQAEVLFDGQHLWQLQQARIDIGNEQSGHLQAQGSFDSSSQNLQGQALLEKLSPAALYSTLDASALSGELTAQTGADQQMQFLLDVQGAPAKSAGLHIAQIHAKGTWQAPVLQVRKLHLDALQAQLQSPALRIDTSNQHVQGDLQLRMPGMQVQAQLNVSATTGQGTVQVKMDSAEQWSAWLGRLPMVQDPFAQAQISGTAQGKLHWQGGWQRLQQRLQNPGAPVQASGLQVNGNLQTPQLRWQSANAQPLNIQNLQLGFQGTPEQLQLQLEAQVQPGAEALTLRTQLTAGLQSGANASAMDWHARVDSLLAQWSVQGDAASTWKATLTSAVTAQQRTTGRPIQSTQIQVSSGQISITPPTRAGNTPGQLSWEPMQLQQQRNGQWGMRSAGRLQGIPLTWLHAIGPAGQPSLLTSSGVSGDLVVQGRWDVDNIQQPLRADVVLERSSGDIRLSVESEDASNITVVRSSGASTINNETHQVRSNATVGSRGRSARLQELRMQVHAQGNDLRAQMVWKSERAGTVAADLSSQFSPGLDGQSSLNWSEQAPLSGTVRASLPSVGIWAFFAPPGWRVGGSLEADLRISGTRSAPTWAGYVNADDLSVQSLLDGLDLKNGRLRSRLEGTRLNITELFLRGGEGSNTRILGQSGNLTAAPKDGGTLTGQGFVEYTNQPVDGESGIRMDLQARAEQLQVLVRSDRQLSISGDLRAALDNGQVKLRGDLQVDRATIMLADTSAPTLDSDVHVHSAASRAAAAKQQAQQSANAAGSVQATQPPDILLNLDLGRDFALQGYGITTRLEGSLQVSNGPRITGEIHTVNGRYRAWGQSLDVESGTIRFNGPYANPSIEIIAIRPNIEVRAGAKVTGSANDPRVALFSEPDMSDAEKLSWIVMGRSAAAGGAETALLQQAALALLSGGSGTGNFAGNLGLDEIGLKGPSDDGETGAAVTVGKRLSKDLYVVYEQSLSGAMGTLYIFYDLSRRLTLRGQTGEQSAIDLIYTTTKD